MLSRHSSITRKSSSAPSSSAPVEGVAAGSYSAPLSAYFRSPQLSSSSSLPQQQQQHQSYDPAVLAESLASIKGTLRQVLSIEVEMERNVRDLMTGQRTLLSGQSNMQNEISDLGRRMNRTSVGASQSQVGHVASTISSPNEVLPEQLIVRRMDTGASLMSSSPNVAAEWVRSNGARIAGASVLESDSGADDKRDLMAPALQRSRGAADEKTEKAPVELGGSEAEHLSLRFSRWSIAPGLAGSTVYGDHEEADEKLNALLGVGHQGSGGMAQLTSLSEINQRRRAMDPHCHFRVTHDLLSIAVLGFDVISAPVLLAWDLTMSGFLHIFSIISMGFWTWDMVMSFMTGFYVQGELEARPRQVAMRYMKSWFVPDIVVILADVVTLCLASSSRASSGALRLSKVSRFLRLARLARLVRVSEAFLRLAEVSVTLEICVETAKPLFTIVLVNHMLACAWWSISSQLYSDTGLHWIDEPLSQQSADTYSDVGVLYQYLTCLHWSLTQLTPGSMQVFPANSLERAFNCFCLLLGVLLFSSLISSFSAKMMQHYLRQKDKMTKLTALRRFLANRVQPGISIAAQWQAEKAMSSNTGKPVTFKEVAAIHMLPQAMQRKIKAELCVKHLQHPLLRWWFVMDPKGADALCNNAIDFVGLAEEDHLFFARAAAIGAYVMTSGIAMYTLESEERLSALDRQVEEGRFFCEAALWCKWKHVGEVTATTGCELFSISTSGLTKSLEGEMLVKHVVVQFGKSFYMRLSCPLFPEGDRPNDMSVAFTEFDSILPSLPSQCRQLIGAVALSTAKQKKGKKVVDDSYVKEVREGKCCLMINWEGDVERIVSLIVLRLARQDGKVLAQLGEWNEDLDCAQSCCKLPGKKQKEGETPSQTFNRLLRGALAPFAHTVTIVGAEQEVTWKESKRMLLSTKYLRTIKYAELSCPPDGLGLELTQMMFRKGRSSVGSEGFAARVSTASQPPSFVDESIDMYALADQAEEITFVGWLSPEELSYYMSPQGEACLSKIMQNVNMEPRIIEAAKERFSASQEPEISFASSRDWV